MKKSAPLLLILGLFTLLAVYQSIVLPLGEAADETDHYQYLRFVARAGHPPLTAAERREAGFKGGLAPLYYWLAAWPIALVGEDTPPDIRRVDSRPERHIPTDGLGLNHVLHTLDEQWPWRGQPLAWHLVRLLSAPLGWITIVATYALARQVAPQTRLVALAAAGFVAFLPRFVISSAVINDDNLVFALTALLLLVQVKLLLGSVPPSTRLMAVFGTLFGLTLVTKYFSLILIPEILLTLGLLGWRSRRAGLPLKTGLWPLAAFVLALLVTAGLWFGFISLRFNRIEELGLIAGLAASLGEPQITEGLVGLLSGQSVRPAAATYSLPDWFWLLYRSFWFEYGWMRLFAPAWVYLAFSIFSGLALIGLGWPAGAIPRLSNNKMRHEDIENPLETPRLRGENFVAVVIWLLGLHLALFGLVVLARYVLSATIDTGQGRHLFPALPVIALGLALGLYRLPGVIGLTAGWRRLCFAAGSLIFLIPALIALSPGLTPAGDLVPARYISPHYHTHPVTTAPLELPPDRRLALEFAPGLALIGYQVDDSAPAGGVLPVTLYWRAEGEATQDYLLSVCLENEAGQPAACWRGQFENGRYPARAWEAGDTLIDTIYLPIPGCDRLAAQSYTLRLVLWPLDQTSAQLQPANEPSLDFRFEAPRLTLRPADSPRPEPPAAELWRESEELTAPLTLRLGETLTRLDDLSQNPDPDPGFVAANAVWLPTEQFSGPLFLACDGGPAPVARLSSFLVSPTLPGGEYQPQAAPSLPAVQLANRDRIFAPLTATLSFSQALSPLQLSVPGQTVALSATPGTPPAPARIDLAEPLLPVTIRWHTRRWLAEPLVAALKLLDKDFVVGGERIATLGDRYPNVLWVPGELVEETYPLRLAPGAPPGLYQLELGLIRQDERLPEGYENLPLMVGGETIGQQLYPLTVRLLDPAHASPPPQPFDAQLGETIRLVGYELKPTTPDSDAVLALTLYWQSTGTIPIDYTVFTQLLGPDGQVWAQWDNPPQAGRYPTTAWRPNDRVVDRYMLTLRDGAPAGDYRLLVGMYDPATGERLPAAIKQEAQPHNALELTTIAVHP